MFGIVLTPTFIVAVAISVLDEAGIAKTQTIDFQMKRLAPAKVRELVKSRDDFYYNASPAPDPEAAVEFDVKWLQEFVTGWRRPGSDVSEPLPDGDLKSLVENFRSAAIHIFGKYTTNISGAAQGN